MTSTCGYMYCDLLARQSFDCHSRTCPHGFCRLCLQVVLHGLPIRPAFSQRQPPPWKLRKQLGLRRDEPAVLLVGGGEGMGPVEKTVASIAAGPGARVQLVVVCGRNAKLVTRLSERVQSFTSQPYLASPSSKEHEGSVLRLRDSAQDSNHEPGMFS